MNSTLTNLRNFPPNGYLYREPSVPWVASPDLALQGLDAVAKALQTVRLQNPWLNLDPDYDACVEAIKQYTCARVKNDPFWCSGSDAASKTGPVAPKVRKACCGG